MQRVFKHTVITRIMHWAHATSMVILALTGIQIYAPDSFRVFPTLDWARYLHFIFMYLVVWTMVYKIYYVLVTGEIKELLFTFTFKDIKELLDETSHYFYGIFIGRKPKKWDKFNPGQRFIYTLWPIFMILQAITGFALYWPELFSGFNTLMGGLGYVRLWHFCISWIFILTMAGHIYLGSTGATFWYYYKSIFTGYEETH